jgi:hypothetical protein
MLLILMKLYRNDRFVVAKIVQSAEKNVGKELEKEKKN